MRRRLLSGVPEYLHNNFLFYYLDIGVWGFYTGSTIVFLSVYATREGATTQQIGLMNAGPAVIALLLSIPFGLFARRFTVKRSVAWSAFLSRVLLIIYALIPSFVPASLRIPALLVTTYLIAIPTTLINITFAPLFISALPPEWRGVVQGTRIAIMSVISFLVTLACGQILVHVPYPTGYQIVFFIGFLGAVTTAYALKHIQVHEPDQPLQSGLGWAQQLFPKIDTAGRHYLAVIAILFGLNMVAFMGAPLLPQLYVHRLNLDDAVISVGTAINSILVFLISLFMARMTRRIGNRSSTALGILVVVVQTLILAAAKSPVAFLAASVVGGMAAGVLNTAQFNYHLEQIPRVDSTVWVSWNSMLGNIAALLGSVAGPALASAIGIPWTLAVLAAARFVLGLVLWVWG